MKIPVEIYLAYCGRDEDDTQSFELSVTIPPHDDSKTTATVEQTLEGAHSVLCIHRNGLAELSNDLKAGLLLALFRLAHREMMEADRAAMAIERTFPDIANYLKAVFGGADFPELCYQLANSVDPSHKATSKLLVRID